MEIKNLKEQTIKENKGLDLEFSPESDNFVVATEEYRSVWESEKDKIIYAMERISDLKFLDNKIGVIIFEGVSSAGFGDSPMKLRAGYNTEVKIGTMIHELGHRLIAQITERPENLDEHRILFLVLYDIWTDLYGQEFADKMVGVEKKRKGVYDYESAWLWALSLSKEERINKFKELT